MKKQLIPSVLVIIGLFTIGLFVCGTAFGEKTDSRPKKGSGPPPQAYEDCKGKKAGDAVQHTTREGIVSATCVDSPQGLVARPDQPPSGAKSEGRSAQGTQQRDSNRSQKAAPAEQ